MTVDKRILKKFMSKFVYETSVEWPAKTTISGPGYVLLETGKFTVHDVHSVGGIVDVFGTDILKIAQAALALGIITHDEHASFHTSFNDSRRNDSIRRAIDLLHSAGYTVKIPR